MTFHFIIYDTAHETFTPTISTLGEEGWFTVLAKIPDKQTRRVSTSFKCLPEDYDYTQDDKTLAMLESMAVNITAVDIENNGDVIDDIHIHNYSSGSYAECLESFISYGSKFAAGDSGKEFMSTINKVIEKKVKFHYGSISSDNIYIVDEIEVEKSDDKDKEKSNEADKAAAAAATNPPVSTMEGGYEDEEELKESDEYKTADAEGKKILLTFKANAIHRVIELIELVDPSIKYLGFDPQGVRIAFITSQVDRTVVGRNLILAFAAYAHVGNNISKLTNKRVDVKVSSKVFKCIEAMGIMKTASRPDSATLPRLAISFMPEYLTYRKFLTKDLQNQTQSSMDVVYKDVVFAGCSSIWSISGYDTFHKEFSHMIYKPSATEPVAIDDKAFLKDYSKWLDVSQNGYRRDTKIHNRMVASINASNKTKDEAITTIIESFNEYNPNN